MDIHNHTLNRHYSIPENLWNALVEMFAQLPHYRGFTDGCPQWYGYDGKLIEASLEASGLQFYAELPQQEWDDWFADFKNKAEKILGYPIGEPEAGFDFRIYE